MRRTASGSPGRTLPIGPGGRNPDGPGGVEFNGATRKGKGHRMAVDRKPVLQVTLFTDYI